MRSYSFESFCTSPCAHPPEPATRDGWGGDVNTNVQWCAVVKASLGDLRMVLGGEVDCVDGALRWLLLRLLLSEIASRQLSPLDAVTHAAQRSTALRFGRTT